MNKHLKSLSDPAIGFLGINESHYEIKLIIRSGSFAMQASRRAACGFLIPACAFGLILFNYMLIDYWMALKSVTLLHNKKND